MTVGDATYSAWLIEREAAGLWWGGLLGEHGWTTDVRSAVRFSRECDARAVIDGQLADYESAVAREFEFVDPLARVNGG